MSKIGFIGLGHMGEPMVQNLLSHGHDVMVFDLREEAISACVEKGALAASSLQDIAGFADVIFTMVQTGEQVQGLCLGEAGLFENVEPNTLFIDCSSIDVTTCRQLHEAAGAKGLRYLDAPVSGGVAGAQAASLTIMVGGDDDVFASAKPLFEQLGKNIIHAGAAGNGQAAKICNNMLLGISMIGVCEAFNLGKQLGLEPKKFFDISSQASGQCWSMTSYCPEPGMVEAAPSNRDYQPGFTALMMLKDLGLSQDAAAAVDAATPLGKDAKALYQQLSEAGMGDKDFSVMIEFLKDK
jgi:3-hydroxyisobutyrate dehydrogenase